MRRRPVALDAAERTAVAGELGPSWRLIGEHLERRVSLERYLDGVELVVAIAAVAERLNHHPELTLSYGQLLVRVTTDELGQLSDLDVDLARQLEVLLGER